VGALHHHLEWTLPGKGLGQVECASGVNVTNKGYIVHPLFLFYHAAWAMPAPHLCSCLKWPAHAPAPAQDVEQEQVRWVNKQDHRQRTLGQVILPLSLHEDGYGSGHAYG